jgi:poly(3-hydroxybutyrate) depolymerase
VKKPLGVLLIAAILVFSFGFALTAEAFTLVTWDEANPPTITKPTEPNRLPLTGYFEKLIGTTGRTAKVYIAASAPIRSYFTVIAIPDGVDAGTFIENAGWVRYADSRRECLYILEPQTVWGSVADEQAYMDEAMTWLNAGMKVGEGDAAVSVLSTFGIHYFVGYGKGAAPLEAWVACNPLRAITQAYVDSDGVDAATLAAAGATEGPLMAPGPIVAPERLIYTDMVMPSLYITSDTSKISASLAYWRKANDVVEPGATIGTVTTYTQKIDSARWMTDFVNSSRKAEGKMNGFSKVVVNTVTPSALVRAESYYQYTDEIVSFLSEYTRYESGFLYGNTLFERANFAALGIEERVVSVPGATNSTRREYLLYVPAGLDRSKAAPLLLVYPGNSQTDKVFVDATRWWYVAQENNFIMAILCEDYNEAGNFTTVSHYDSEAFTEAVLAEMKKGYNIDEERIYLTGQSAGSMASQLIAVCLPEKYAAVASTSALPSPGPGTNFTDIEGKSNIPIPAYMMYGEGDNAMILPSAWQNENFKLWTEYHLGNWKLKMGEESHRNTAEYTFTDTTANSIHGYQTWTWSLISNPPSIPVVQVTKTDNRGHNCYPAEMAVLWDFLKHYKVVQNADGTRTRYYSASGFILDDAVTIAPAEVEPKSGGGCSTGTFLPSVALVGAWAIATSKKS